MDIRLTFASSYFKVPCYRAFELQYLHRNLQLLRNAGILCLDDSKIHEIYENQ